MVTSPGIRALMAPGWVRDPLWTRAQRVPSLDLRFAANRSLMDHASGAQLVTFTRASSATVIGPTGLIETAATDVPRFQHDPTTGRCLGLLVEGQRQNLLVRSEEFDNASWTKTGLLAFGGGSVANSTGTLAPDGTNTADLVVEDTSTGAHQLQQGVPASGTAYSYSIYAKAAGRTKLAITGGGFTGQGFTAVFNLVTGTLDQNTGGKGSITDCGNGWYRCVISFTTSTTVAFSVLFVNDLQSTSYTGNGTSGIYLWGAQLEAGAFPTSYIPTTGTSATRSADVATITGTAFSRWYRQDEGSFFCSTFAPRGVVVFGTGDTFNDTQYVTVGSSNNVSFRSGGSDQAILTASVSTTAATSIAIAYAQNSFAAVSGGGAVSTDTSGNVSAGQVRLKVGSSSWDSAGGNNLNGIVSRLTYWPARLANSVLQALSL